MKNHSNPKRAAPARGGKHLTRKPILGAIRNEICLLITAPAVLAFFAVRLYPPLMWMAIVFVRSVIRV